MSDVTVQIGDVIHVSIEDVAQASPLLALDPPAPTIAALLAQSRAAHTQYHGVAGSINKDGTLKTNPDEAASIIAIQAALDARQQAQVADPTHSDPAWKADQQANRGVTSDALIQFYLTYLAD